MDLAAFCRYSSTLIVPYKVIERIQKLLVIFIINLGLPKIIDRLIERFYVVPKLRKLSILNFRLSPIDELKGCPLCR